MSEKCNLGSLAVYYNDYELTERQLSKRYNGLEFSHRLFRVSIDFTKNLSGLDIGKLLIEHCEIISRERNPVTIFVDNISVFDSLDLENRREAGQLLADLNRLKKMYHGFTIVILAHTPKVEKGPILKEHLAGSKQLTNLIDGLVGFARAESDDNLFYMKQLKQRDASIEFNYENVITFYIDKKDSHLIPVFNGYGFENHLLKTPKDKARKERNEIILNKYQGGISMEALAKEFNLSRQGIYKIIKNG